MCVYIDYIHKNLYNKNYNKNWQFYITPSKFLFTYSFIVLNRNEQQIYEISNDFSFSIDHPHFFILIILFYILVTIYIK